MSVTSPNTLVSESEIAEMYKALELETEEQRRRFLLLQSLGVDEESPTIIYEYRLSHNSKPVVSE